MTTENRKYRRLTHGEVFKVMSLLNQHLAPVGEDTKVYRYLDGWTDAKIAEAAIPTFEGDGVTAVGRMRIKEFGPLYEAEPDQALSDRVAQLENILAHICRQLDIKPEDVLNAA